MPPTDEDLLAASREGDREALAALLGRHAPSVRRTVTGRIPARWQAVLSEDDVLQQTWADAALSLHRFEPRPFPVTSYPGTDEPGARVDDETSSPFAAWLTTLARCNLVDALRMLEADKRGGGWRRIDPADQGPEAELMVTTTTPSRCVATGEARRALEAALVRLPAPYAAVVRLYDLEGRSIESVAREMDRSPGAVYMLRARAHEHIRRTMGAASRFFTHG